MHLCHLQNDFIHYFILHFQLFIALDTTRAENPGFYFTATGLMFIMVLANTYIIW